MSKNELRVKNNLYFLYVLHQFHINIYLCQHKDICDENRS
jgi:hypothetical protein